MTMKDDPHDLRRFVDAQAPVIADVLAELDAGEKRSHWMWFVFPQVAGLGSTPMSVRYSIGSLEEAAAYLAHPVLGPRLLDCTRRVLAVEGRSIERILGGLDAMKFHASMTLFGRAAPGEPMFARALSKYFGGEPHARTLALV
jgi:uncharacterized protein (DUF1810 family)